MISLTSNITVLFNRCITLTLTLTLISTNPSMCMNGPPFQSPFNPLSIPFQSPFNHDSAKDLVDSRLVLLAEFYPERKPPTPPDSLLAHRPIPSLFRSRTFNGKNRRRKILKYSNFSPFYAAWLEFLGDPILCRPCLLSQY